jgi:hypothetical protein
MSTSDVSELRFQHKLDTDTVNASTKQKGRKRVGTRKVKKKDKAMSTSVSMALQCDDNATVHGSERVQIQ